MDGPTFEWGPGARLAAPRIDFRLAHPNAKRRLREVQVSHRSRTTSGIDHPPSTTSRTVSALNSLVTALHLRRSMTPMLASSRVSTETGEDQWGLRRGRVCPAARRAGAPFGRSSAAFDSQEEDRIE
jgi:hypothetical protein